MSTNTYTPTHTPEELEEFLPGLRESMQNFDINDCDIEQIEDSFGENNNMYGLKHLPESIQLMREASTGVFPSAETRKKKSEAVMGKKNPLYGKNHSAESIKKMREAKIGNKASEETKKKMRESAKTRPPISEETRKKLSVWQKGVPKTEEHKKKISESHRNRKKLL